MRRFQTVCLEMSFVSHSNFCLLCLILYFCCCSHSAGVFGLSFSFWWQFQVECLFVQTSGSTMFNRLSRERELGSIKIMKKESESEVAQSCPTLCNPLDAHQALPSMGFSRQEYWSGLPFPSPGDLPNPGIEPRSPALQTDALPSEPLGKPKLQFLVLWWFSH